MRNFTILKHIKLFIFFTVSTGSLTAQTLDTLTQEVSPEGGINQLALHYYGIEFSKEQRNTIQGVEIEFIYSIDESGNIIQTEINGVNDSAVLDSLHNKTAMLEPFSPSIKNGVPEPSIYFVKLTFPSYPFTNRTYGILQGAVYNEATLEDFEYIKESGRRLHVLFGAVANQFVGKPAKHLAFGGGMKMDMGFTAKNKLIYGMNMSFYGNKLKENYPLMTTREQLKGPPTVLVGLMFGKKYGKLNVVGELNLAIQNVTEKIGEDDPDWIQLDGWSPGIVINYPLQLGNPSPMYSYGAPNLLTNNLNIHFGLRYLDFSLREASGIMLELGVAYKMEYRPISEYKLKKDFLDRENKLLN